MIHIGEFRHKATKLTDLVPWAYFIDDGLVLNKDGSFQKSFRFRGPDRESATINDLMALRAQLNNALRRLGTRWAVYVEAQRVEVRDYLSGAFPDPVTWQCDDVRRQAFEASDESFETYRFLTFVYLPPAERIGWAQQLFLEGDTSQQAVDYRRELDYFLDQVRSVTGVLAGFMPTVEPLDTAQTLTYLHSCVSTRHVSMVAPECPVPIDALVCDCPVYGGFDMRLGDRHVRVVSVIAHPGRTVPAMLDALDHLPLPFRWVVRYMPLSPTDAAALISKRRRQYWGKRKSIVSLFKEAVLRQEETPDDPDAVAKEEDARTAQGELGEGHVSFGYTTLTVTVTGRDAAEANERAKRVQEVVDGLGFASTTETVNLPEAWFGSLSGLVYADPRTAVMMSLNLCDLIPAHSVWTGPRWNKHLDGPVLFMAKTQGSTPFRFSNFYQDVGHLAVIGPTGSGKTTFLNLVVASYRRYPDSQVFIFDKGAGTRALTLAVGGEFVDLGTGLASATEGGDAAATTRGVAFQPLGGVDDEAERRWALGWLIDDLQQENVQVTTSVKEALRSALEVLARNERKQRTMSVFVGLLQHREAKEALRQYTLAGAYGRFFDADEDQLNQNDWQTFETEQLLGVKAIVVPVLMYLFHRLEQRFRDGRPTLLVLDEVWSVLLIGVFAEKFREWLKVLRKKNVAVVFATQSLSDLTDSPAASAVIDGCPTRVFLANPKATDPVARGAYEGFGLNDQQIDLVAKATPKRHYYYQNPEGNRLFELGLSDLELAFFAAGSAQDQRLIDQILREHGRERFAEQWLRAKGLDETADRLSTSTLKESEVSP